MSVDIKNKEIASPQCFELSNDVKIKKHCGLL